ncbi:MAG: DNA sulfur modification protein DndE [Prolixibacteraceae bacterium]|jgi:DNA sulfur modification protein DndE|nr:DNA sulfur modification protein DndE [Prolixibacteraceae bacterium]
MTFQRVKLSKPATFRLQQLKGKTGLTPNILARIAVCYSLNEPKIPNPAEYDEEGQEINRYTLTGEWDSLFMALIRERCIEDGLDPENDLFPQFRAHMNRGVMSIFSRIKDLSDFRSLLPAESLLLSIRDYGGEE